MNTRSGGVNFFNNSSTRGGSSTSTPPTNIFANNSSNKQSNSPNIFGNNSNTNNQSNNSPSSGFNNIFNKQNSTSTNMFNNNSSQNNSSGNGGNQGSSNIFGNNQNQTNNMFNNSGSGGNSQNSNTQNGTANIFNNNQRSNNVLGNNSQNTGNIFGNNNQSNGTQNNIFGNNNNRVGSGNNLFNNNQQGGGNNLFNNNNQQQQGNYQQNMDNYSGGGFNRQAYGMHILTNSDVANYSNEEQVQIFNLFSIDYIRQTINHCKKSLDMKKLDIIALSEDNFLKNQKTLKIAHQFDIKKQLIFVKKELKSKIVDPIKNLKNKQKELQELSLDFTSKVLQKLQIYKNRLIETISRTKMISQIKAQIDELQAQIKDNLLPLHKALQKDKKSAYNFSDPNQFCLKISKRLLNNMNILDNKMDELLACEQETQDNIDQCEVIEQLIEYYQKVALALKEFCDKYAKAKEKALRKGDFSKKISEKAAVKVKQQLEAYQLIKEIQGILQQRDKNLEQRQKLQMLNKFS